MKQLKYILTVIILFCLPIMVLADEDHPYPGIKNLATFEDYKKEYLGKTIKYIPVGILGNDGILRMHPYANSYKFYGRSNIEYVVSKISGKIDRMTWVLQEKDNFNVKIKICLTNQQKLFDKQNTYNINDPRRIPFVLVDEYKKLVASFPKIRVPETGDVYYQLKDIKLMFLEENGSKINDYPSFICQMTNNVTGESIFIKDVNKIDIFDHIGEIIETESGDKYKVIDIDNYLSKTYLLKKENSEDTKILSTSNFKELTMIGHVFTHPLVKASYIVQDIKFVRDRNSIIRKCYIVRNSDTDEVKEVRDEEECFRDDLKGHYIATLQKVQKPEDPSIRYGKTKTITDKGITKFSYEDKYINIVLFVSDRHFDFALTNVSQNSLKIVWNEAAYVDYKGNTSKIIHSGIKYSEKESDQPATTIISGAKIEDIACPANNISYGEISHEYFTDYIFPSTPALTLDPIRLMIPIQVKNVINEYIFVFDVQYVYEHPERLNL